MKKNKEVETRRTSKTLLKFPHLLLFTHEKITPLLDLKRHPALHDGGIRDHVLLAS